MSRSIGRPTSDPGKQYTVFLPKSIAKDIEPRGDESRSKRIFRLIQMGIATEKKNGIDPVRSTHEDQLHNVTNEVDVSA